MEDLIAGEEWRRVAAIDAGDLEEAPSADEVLADARRNIEQIRKSELRRRFADADGRPLSGLNVRIRQLRHAVVFGCSSGSTLEAVAADPAEASRAQFFLELFNGTYAKCYWDENWHQPIERRQGSRLTGRFEAEIAWARANDLEVRGHPLVWTVQKSVPLWLRRYPIEEQYRFLEHHVRSLVALARGRVRTWDLCIEMLWEPTLKNLSKRDWPHVESVDDMVELIAPAMRWAREEDPGALYCIEDYGLETTFTWIKERHGREVTAAGQRRRMVELAQRLAEAGARPDAVCTQAHGSKWFPMGVVWKTFQELSGAGTPIHVSEFWALDADHPDPAGRSAGQIAEDKAQYVTDYFTTAFGTPGVEQICCWGDEAFFTHGGWKVTPAYEALKRLVRKEWWTDIEAVTDSSGELKARVFHGDHLLTWHDARGNLHRSEVRVTPE